jgi:4-diphosphocytidyl-2-C-methyl-D-erythritol kinase
MTDHLVINAPAKINVNLKITGRRDDGYHLLDSIVIFAALADRLTISLSHTDKIMITGPMVNTAADALIEENSTIHQARDAFRATTGWTTPICIEVEKHIPIAAGLGGGSADAAATLRDMASLADIPLGDDALFKIGLGIGADVPALLMSWQFQMLRMEGIGERLTPLLLQTNGGQRNQTQTEADDHPGIMLVNPGVATSTKEVFSAYGENEETFSQALPLSDTNIKDFGALIRMGNDLTKPACKITPAIRDMLMKLTDLSTRFNGYGAAMSGSGATGFAIFPTPDDAKQAEDAFKRAKPASECWSWSGEMIQPLRNFKIESIA